jgi:4-aminobutyrate aminotransferase-like enzyme
MNFSNICQKHKEYLFPCVTNYYSTPLPLKKGKGVYVYDWEDNKYLDFFGGILTVSIGHCQPEIVKEMEDQIHTLQHFISYLSYGDVSRKAVSDNSREVKEVFFYEFGDRSK